MAKAKVTQSHRKGKDPRLARAGVDAINPSVPLTIQRKAMLLWRRKVTKLRPLGLENREQAQQGNPRRVNLLV